jgi:uridine kinase
MARRVDPSDAVEQVRALSGPGTLFVAIDGHGGVGKSTLARAIRQQVAGVTVVGLDELNPPNVPDWDWRGFHEQVVTPLQEGRTGKYQAWDSVGNAPGEWQEVPPGGIVVVEGLGTLRRDLGDDPWSLRIWVEAPYEQRLQRVVDRDGEAMREVWMSQWLPEEDDYVAAHRPHERADLIVDGRKI